MEPTASAVHHTVNFGDFDLYIFPNSKGGEPHVVLIKDLNLSEPVLCRIASECLPGTAFDSAECDCKEQIDISLQLMCEKKSGILIYLRQEGRGIGLANKILALKNKNLGMDTFEAVNELGFPDDSRCYKDAIKILEYFGVREISLVSNNPAKEAALNAEGIIIKEGIRLRVSPSKYSIKHLEAKRAKGHSIDFFNSEI